MIGRLIAHLLGVDNLAGAWYGFWSGFGSIVIPPVLTALPIVFVMLRRHNCHVHHCWRVGRHPSDDGLYRVCGKHHPRVPDRVTQQHVDGGVA